MQKITNKLMLMLCGSVLLTASAYAYDDSFIITVEGSSYTIPTDDDYNYMYAVECTEGEGFSAWQTDDYVCNYDSSGTHQILIEGTYPYFRASSAVKSVDQWGTGQWHSMNYSFSNAYGLQMDATDSPDLTYVSNMSYMFYGAIFNQDIGEWDVSNVTNMEGMFYGSSPNNLNLTLLNWDVSNVTNMRGMFQNASSFDGLFRWDVSNVTNMEKMFSGSAFNHSIGQWNVSNVTNMEGMFNNAKSFNQDIGDWNVSNVTDMNNTFNDAVAFNQDIGNWNVSNVTGMYNMFHSAISFNQDIGNWDVSNVKSMLLMFGNATAFNQNIGDWNVSNVTRMSEMFISATAFNQDIGDWDVSGITYMYSLFRNAAAFNHDIGRWDVSNVSSMQSMFKGASSFNQHIGDWDVSNVTTMGYMFNDASSFNQDIGDWDVSNITTMSNMFSNATSFNQDIGDWNVSNVGYMSNIFNGAYPISISNYDNLLNSWNKLPLKQDVTFDAGDSFYCDGSFARKLLVKNDGWTIYDLGEDCEGFRITSSNSMSVENGQQYVGVVTSTTASEDAYYSISYTIADGDKFTITENGDLSFRIPPEANNPTDKNANNVYRVQVYAYEYGASDAKDYQTIKVTVMPAENDGSLVPVINYLLF